MSGGGPPHHPHSRQAPPTNAAWNHLQVPNYYPSRQPQHAHMSNEHSVLHQPTWHTPTTEPMKPMSHSHIFSLEQMLSDRQFPRHNTTSPGVDLSVTRNGNSQNGELITTTPISLSVRDTNKINSLPVSALDIQPIDINPTIKPISPNLSIETTTKKRSSKRVDSILERLNPNLEKLNDNENNETTTNNKSVIIVQTTSSHDENSNSSSILNVPTPTNIRDDDVVSPYSNEDSLDSNKSRRKRKPSKTIRLQKGEDEKSNLPDQSNQINKMVKEKHHEDDEEEEKKITSELEEISKTRRKTSSEESETIDNIAAMVQESLKSKQDEQDEEKSKPLENVQDEINNVTTTAQEEQQQQKKTTNTQFVEVENKLEEMFAGIEDTTTPIEKPESVKTQLNNDENPASTSQDNVTSTSNDLKEHLPKKVKRKQRRTRNSDCNSIESTPKKKTKKLNKLILNKTKLKKHPKFETMKDVYAYDSSSNTSSNKSRGPFIQIRGPRDSPLSVNVINTPINDEENEKKLKVKKFHDDSEYRHKVRSKGLHCSTLSHQYDAQTKDTSWICAFCKRGPHAIDFIGPTINNIASGDLFGPYFITTNSQEFERRLDDPFDKQFKSKKIARTLDNRLNNNNNVKKKRKLSLDDDIFLGITETTNGSYEIWAHEDCIVWSVGTFLIGPKIIGLEEAVWTSCNVVCVKCHIKGANICCLKRGCVQVVHVCCGKLTNWQFDEENYKTYCPEHRVVL